MRRRYRKHIRIGLPGRSINPNQLTARQQEVLSLIADGKSNKEIAVTLSVTPSTVKGHVTKLLIILGMHTRTELAVFWTENLHRSADGQA